MTEDFKARAARIIERHRPALDRMAYGPYPLEQQCPHLLIRQPRVGLETRYLCMLCDGYYNQFWSGFKNKQEMDEYVEEATGSLVVSVRVRPLLEGEIDPIRDHGPSV